MPAAQIVTPGDDIALVQDLYENGSLVDVSSATITAAIHDGNGCSIIARTAQSSSASGASWATGRIVCEFAASVTTALQIGTVFLEIAVTRSGKRTTWPLVELEVQGTIG